jgi:hypothetical protein
MVSQKFGGRVRQWLSARLSKVYREPLAYLIVFLFNLFLVLPYLTPHLLEINPDDGAKYVESGRLLLTWGFRNLAWGPLVGLVYAPIHLVVGHLPNWFMLEAWIGNVIFYGLMWFSFLALARQLKHRISKYVFVGLLFVLTIFFPIIENQSDALFVALSALALMNVLRFKRTRRLKFAALASLCLGLGVLSRVETVLLALPFIVFIFVFDQKRHRWFQVLLAVLAPLAAVLALYFVINLITFGNLNLGMGYKSYDSFEMNQAFLRGSKNQAAHQRGEPIFGTKEENNGSIFRAMLRNPLAIGERMLAHLLRVPDYYLAFFGKLQGPVTLIFSVLGAYVLIKSKQKWLLLLLLIWPLHAFVSLVFLPRHIIPQMSFIFLLFSAIGITHFFSRQSTAAERWVLMAVAVLLISVSLIADLPAFLTSGLLLLAAALVNLLTIPDVQAPNCLRLMPLMLFLAGMLMLGYGFSFPNLQLGQTADEVAVQQLQAAVPVQSKVLTPYATAAIAAKTTAVLLPSDMTTTTDLLDFMDENDIAAVYLDSNMPYGSDLVQRTVDAAPDYFELVYQSENSGKRIYLVGVP